MARDFRVFKLPLQQQLFNNSRRRYQILTDELSLLDLHRVLRSVISNKYKNVPLTSFEEDVLCDLYNSISLIKFK